MVERSRMSLATIETLVGASRAKGTGVWPAVSRSGRGRRSGFLGAFLGTYLALPYAAALINRVGCTALRSRLSAETTAGRLSARRRFRLVAEICWAVVVMVRSGRSTRPATTHPTDSMAM